MNCYSSAEKKFVYFSPIGFRVCQIGLSSLTFVIFPDKIYNQELEWRKAREREVEKASERKIGIIR